MKWISVEDRLPDPEGDAVIFCVKRHNEICIGRKSTSDKESKLWEDFLEIGRDGDPMDEWDVTHWMPLPEPPKEGE